MLSFTGATVPAFGPCSDQDTFLIGFEITSKANPSVSCSPCAQFLLITDAPSNSDISRKMGVQKKREKNFGGTSLKRLVKVSCSLSQA